MSVGSSGTRSACAGSRPASWTPTCRACGNCRSTPPSDHQDKFDAAFRTPLPLDGEARPGRAELIDGRGVDAVLCPVVRGESRDRAQGVEEGGSGESAILQRGQVEESARFVVVQECVHVEEVAGPCPSPQRESFVGREIIGVQDCADVEDDAALQPPAVGEDLDGTFPPAAGVDGDESVIERWPFGIAGVEVLLLQRGAQGGSGGAGAPRRRAAPVSAVRHCCPPRLRRTVTPCQQTWPGKVARTGVTCGCAEQRDQGRCTVVTSERPLPRVSAVTSPRASR